MALSIPLRPSNSGGVKITKREMDWQGLLQGSSAMSLRVEGLLEVTAELEAKSKTIYRDTMRVMWKAADRGAVIAAGLVRKDSGETADSISPATYSYPYQTRQGVRSVWGPTTLQGRLLETGTAFMAPKPYLGKSLDRVKNSAFSALEKAAFKGWD